MGPYAVAKHVVEAEIETSLVASVDICRLADTSGVGQRNGDWRNWRAGIAVKLKFLVSQWARIELVEPLSDSSPASF